MYKYSGYIPEGSRIHIFHEDQVHGADRVWTWAHVGPPVSGTVSEPLYAPYFIVWGGIGVNVINTADTLVLVQIL